MAGNRDLFKAIVVMLCKNLCRLDPGHFFECSSLCPFPSPTPFGLEMFAPKVTAKAQSVSPLRKNNASPSGSAQLGVERKITLGDEKLQTITIFPFS